MQPRKGTGAKTRTIKINGQTYQERRLTCGRGDACKVCTEEGGHLAYYMDGGKVDGKRKWILVAALPEVDPEYQPAKCQREGCENRLPATAHGKARYCSDACRQAAYRAKQA